MGRALGGNEQKGSLKWEGKGVGEDFYLKAPAHLNV